MQKLTASTFLCLSFFSFFSFLPLFRSGDVSGLAAGNMYQFLKLTQSYMTMLHITLFYTDAVKEGKKVKQNSHMSGWNHQNPHR